MHNNPYSMVACGHPAGVVPDFTEIAMQPYQQRVVNEKSKLDEKIKKLSEFIESNHFARVDQDEQVRMRQQLRAMQTYSDVLYDRIDAF